MPEISSKTKSNNLQQEKKIRPGLWFLRSLMERNRAKPRVGNEIHDFMSADLISWRLYASGMRRLHKWCKTAKTAQFSRAQSMIRAIGSRNMACVYSDASPDYRTVSESFFQPLAACIYILPS